MGGAEGEVHHLVGEEGLNWVVVVVVEAAAVEVEASRRRAGVAAGLMRLVGGEVGYHIHPSHNHPYWTFRVGHPYPVHQKTCSLS